MQKFYWSTFNPPSEDSITEQDPRNIQFCYLTQTKIKEIVLHKTFGFDG